MRLRAAGIPVVDTRFADDPAEAGRAATTLARFPVVVKAGGLLHKSEHGGVMTDLPDAAAATAAAQALIDRFGPETRPLLVQPQLAGTEILVGVRREPAVATAVLVGFGGIHAEILDDTALALAPLSPASALRLLQSLRGWPLLAGHRGGQGVDLDALCRVLVAAGGLATAATDIAELDLNPVLVGSPGEGAVAVDARMLVLEPVAASPRSRAGLGRVLRPGHVAVIGVSDDPSKAGARVFSYLRRHGFPGRLDAVHPSGGSVHDQPRLRTLDDVEGSPDLVCVAVPAAAVLDVAAAAVRKGVGGLVVHSSGFADGGGEGARIQDELVRMLAAGGVRLIGPNSMGVVSPASGLAASIGGVLERERLPAGGIGVLSASGALAGCLASRLWASGAGVSHWISVGNEADVDVAEYLDWFADDETTSTLGVIVEHVSDGARTIAAGHRLARTGIPTFACSIGRTAGGAAAARSHTGALLGSSRLRDAVLSEAGMVLVDDLDTLEDALRLAGAGQLPVGPRLGVITASGGASALTADAAEHAGLALPALPPAVEKRIARLLPSYAGIGNPLDVTAQTMNHPERFEDVLRACADAGGFDALLVQFTTNADPNADITARAVIAVQREAGIPVYVSRYGAPDLAPQGLASYRDAGIPVLASPALAVRAVAALVQAGRVRRDLQTGSATARLPT